MDAEDHHPEPGVALAVEATTGVDMAGTLLLLEEAIAEDIGVVRGDMRRTDLAKIRTS